MTGFAGDLRRGDEVTASLKATRPEVAFHLGARVDVSRDPALDSPMREVLYEGTLRVHDALDGGLLVHVGTCEEYGTIAAPYAESDVPSEPVSPYARWKLATTRELLRRGGAPVVVARPFLTYGPGQRPRQLVPAAIRAALAGQEFPMTTGEQTREWNYVDDTVAGLLRCGSTPAVVGSVVNVCGGPELSVADMVRRIFSIAGATPSLVRVGAIPQRSGEVARFFGDDTRCREVLGHRPSVDLDAGIAATVRWWREQLAAETPP